jgi:hypothetical protein
MREGKVAGQQGKMLPSAPPLHAAATVTAENPTQRGEKGAGEEGLEGHHNTH